MPEVKVLAGLASSESSLLGLQGAHSRCPISRSFPCARMPQVSLHVSSSPQRDASLILTESPL